MKLLIRFIRVLVFTVGAIITIGALPADTRTKIIKENGMPAYIITICIGIGCIGMSFIRSRKTVNRYSNGKEFHKEKSAGVRKETEEEKERMECAALGINYDKFMSEPCRSELKQPNDERNSKTQITDQKTVNDSDRSTKSSGIANASAKSQPQVDRNYHQCSLCGLLLKTEKEPQSHGCSKAKGQAHKWNYLGRVGTLNMGYEVINIKNYQCLTCATMIQTKGQPQAGGCPKGDRHNWQDLGIIGVIVYQCSRCSTVIESAESPNINNCLSGGIHNWKRM